MRSAYHMREVDVWKMRFMKSPVDIFFSHDWPKDIVSFGNHEDLFRAKPFLKDDPDFGMLFFFLKKITQFSIMH